MAAFRYKGFTYELIIRPWKKGDAKYEAIKWQTGFRNLWERISYSEFLKIKSKAGSKIEYRMIDHDMFDEEMIREMNSMGEKGWKVIRILDPMKWLNSDEMFIRVFYKREQKQNGA